MLEYDLVQTWIPASMIGALLFIILLDSLWLARRNRKAMERAGGDGGPSTGGGGGNGRSSETKWHDQNKADVTERQWHDANRAVLRNKQGTAAQAVGAAPTAAAALGGGSAPQAGGYWGPWIVLTSLILGSGIAFYALVPLLQD